MHQTCIWNTGHMQSIAGPVLASAAWTEKKITLNCSYRIFIICRHRSVPSFGPGFFCLNSGLSKVQWTCQLCSSLCTYFRDNAVTGDIPLISLVLKSMVSPCYLVYIYVRDFWDILCQAALTICVLARLCWASIGTGRGKWHCLRPQCLQFTNNTYTIWLHIH